MHRNRGVMEGFTYFTTIISRMLCDERCGVAAFPARRCWRVCVSHVTYHTPKRIELQICLYVQSVEHPIFMYYVTTFSWLITGSDIYSHYTLEFYAVSHNSLWYKCFRLREKKNRLLEPITKVLERTICLYVYCQISYFMHYVTITSSNMYSTYTL